MEVTAECGRGGEGCCRAGGEEAKEKYCAKADRTAQVVPLDDAAAQEVMPPYVMTVDDSSVDRALVTALLRRSKYRGTYLASSSEMCAVLYTPTLMFSN
jgi:two-component response regulator (ARR-A family)